MQPGGLQVAQADWEVLLLKAPKRAWHSNQYGKSPFSLVPLSPSRLMQKRIQPGAESAHQVHATNNA